MKIICIAGKARHGKDTCASILKDILTERGNRVLIAHYGDLVKFVCKTYFGWDGEKNEAGRSLLQRVGTDVVRAQAPNYWVDFVIQQLKFFDGEWDYVLIPDCRFPNEIDEPKKAGFDVKSLLVVRDDPDFVSPLTAEQQNHPSEVALEKAGYVFDHIVFNTHTLDSLKQKLAKLFG